MHMTNVHLLVREHLGSFEQNLVLNATDYMQRMIYCMFRDVVWTEKNVMRRIKDKQDSNFTKHMQRCSNSYSTALIPVYQPHNNPRFQYCRPHLVQWWQHHFLAKSSRHTSLGSAPATE
jgi:hypothetical protein